MRQQEIFKKQKLELHCTLAWCSLTEKFRGKTFAWWTKPCTSLPTNVILFKEFDIESSQKNEDRGCSATIPPSI